MQKIMEDNLKKEIETEARELLNKFKLKLNNFRSNEILINVISEIKIDDPKGKKKIGNISSLKISNGKLIILPFEQKNSSKITSTILNENLGYSLSNDSKINEISLFLNPMSKETKENITKKVSEETEKWKASLRIIRQKFIKKTKEEKEKIDDIIKKYQKEMDEEKEIKIKKIMK